MYCCIDEAFDSPLKQQIRMVEKEQQINNNKFALVNDIANYQEENNLVPPHEIIPKYNPIEHERNNYPESLSQQDSESDKQSFFTTQGSMYKGKLRENNNLEGTTIDTIKRNRLKEETHKFDHLTDSITPSSESLSDLDDISNYPRSQASGTIESTDLPLSVYPYKDDPSHKEYITKFLHEFTGKGSHNTYSHIKDCPHCKNIITDKFKKIKLFENEKKDVNTIKSKEKEHMTVTDNVHSSPQEKYTLETDREPSFLQSLVWKGEFKEIMVVLLIGFITIILLDIFVHFNKKH